MVYDSIILYMTKTTYHTDRYIRRNSPRPCLKRALSRSARAHSTASFKNHQTFLTHHTVIWSDRKSKKCKPNVLKTPHTLFLTQYLTYTMPRLHFPRLRAYIGYVKQLLTPWLFMGYQKSAHLPHTYLNLIQSFGISWKSPYHLFPQTL